MDLDELRDELSNLRESRTKVTDLLERNADQARENRQARTALMVDGDPEDRTRTLQAERRELEAERRDLEEMLPVLSEKIREAEAELREAAVLEVGQSLRKIGGGLAGEQPRDLRRAEEHRRKAEEYHGKAERKATRSSLLADAADALRQTTGVGVGRVKRVAGARRTVIGRHLDLGNLRKAGREALKVLDAEGLLSNEVRDAVEGAVSELDDAEEERRRRAVDRERSEARAEEGRQKREAVDEALRRRLRSGPHPKAQVVRWVKEQGFPLARDPAQADLASARRRVGVVSLYREEGPSRTTWWWIPPEDGAEPPEGFRRSARGRREPSSPVFR